MSLSLEFKRFPSHWEVLPFLDAVKDSTSKSGKIPKSEYKESGEIPIVDQGKALFAGYTDDVSLKSHVTSPAIIFGDHTRAFKYIEGEFCLGADGAKVLEPKAGLDKRFLYHYLNQLNIESAGYSRHFKFLKETYVPVPPLKEQKRIAAILDKADGIRRKRQQAIQLADDFLTAAYIERFGDPSQSSYEILELKKVTKKITDGAHFTPTYTESGVPFLRVTDISKGVLDWNKTKFIPKSEHEELIKRCNPEKGDVLYSKNGTIGIPRLIDWDKEFSIFVSLCLIKPDERYLRGKYLESFLKTPFALKQAKTKSKSATVTNLHLVEIKEIKLPVPPLKIQDEWVQFLDRYNTLLDKMKKSQLNSGHSFNSLSQKAFKGEL